MKHAYGLFNVEFALFGVLNKLIEKFPVLIAEQTMSSTTNCLNFVTIFNFIINLFRTHFAFIWFLSRLKYSYDDCSVLIALWLFNMFLICKRSKALSTLPQNHPLNCCLSFIWKFVVCLQFATTFQPFWFFVGIFNFFAQRREYFGILSSKRVVYFAIFGKLVDWPI